MLGSGEGVAWGLGGGKGAVGRVRERRWARAMGYVVDRGEEGWTRRGQGGCSGPEGEVGGGGWWGEGEEEKAREGQEGDGGLGAWRKEWAR